MEDNEKIKLGTGDDLEIYHDGNNSFIKDAGTGRLSIVTSQLQLTNAADSEVMIKATQDDAVELYHNGTKKFETYANGVIVTGTVAADLLALGDNEKLMCGIGDDLQLYHDGSNSYIKNTTNDLIIWDDSRIRFRSPQYMFNNAANDENILIANENGGVELYYDNSKKFDTVSGGVEVHGNLQMDDNGVAKFGTGGDMEIFHDGAQSYIRDVGTGNLKITSSGAGVDIDKGSSEHMARFKTDAEVELYYDNSQKFETTSGGVKVTGGCEGNPASHTASCGAFTPDFGAAAYHLVSMNANLTINAPSNQAIGQSGSLFLTQDGTGNRVPSFNSAFKWTGGTQPTFTTTASKVDRVDYVVKASGEVHAVASLLVGG